MTKCWGLTFFNTIQLWCFWEYIQNQHGLTVLRHLLMYFGPVWIEGKLCYYVQLCNQSVNWAGVEMCVNLSSLKSGWDPDNCLLDMSSQCRQLQCGCHHYSLESCDACCIQRHNALHNSLGCMILQKKIWFTSLMGL